MSRKDYELIARALSSVKPVENADALVTDQWERDCEAISRALLRDNGRFDQSRFLRACGYRVTI